MRGGPWTSGDSRRLNRVVPAPAGGGTAPEVFARFRAHDWIGNSRNTADEDVIRTLASMAGFTPRITHRADSLDLVQDMIIAGLGVGLLPLGRAVQPGVRLLPLTGPRIELRAYAVARRRLGRKELRQYPIPVRWWR